MLNGRASQHCLSAQGSEATVAAESEVAEAPSTVAVVDSASLLDMDPVFVQNLAELLDGLGILRC